MEGRLLHGPPINPFARFDPGRHQPLLAHHPGTGASASIVRLNSVGIPGERRDGGGIGAGTLTDHFLISAPDLGQLRDVLTSLREAFHAHKLLEAGTIALVEVPDFEWSKPPSVTRLAREAGIWFLPPVVYFEGTETYRLVAPSRGRVNRLIARVRRLGDVELLSIVDLDDLSSLRDLPVATVHFFEGLTQRQATSLLSALEGGLLDVPARGRWDAVAHREGLSRSTFGEHLRKGLLQLVRNSYAPLRARTRAETEPQMLPAKRQAHPRRRNPLHGRRDDDRVA